MESPPRSPPPQASFVKRSRPRKLGAGAGTRTRSTDTQLASSSTSVQDQSAADTAGDAGADEPAVVRTAGLGGKKEKKKMMKKTAAALSFGVEEEEESGKAFQLRKSALSKKAAKGKLSLPDSLDQASIGASPSAHQRPRDDYGALPGASTGSSSYSAAALAALKAATPSARPQSSTDGDAQAAHIDLDDPMAGPDELTRTKFGADFAHDDIPSEAVINSAKEKRARMLASGGSSAEDFIALGGASGKRNGKTGGAAGAVARWDEKTARGQGPHPESRLMREEDELGEGDDELAEYTGAQERMPLGKKAEAAHEARRKEEMREALADGGEDAEMDEEDEEWEQAQMRRNEMPGIRKESRRSERERSPYVPAPVPQTAPLPSMNAASARLAQSLRALEESSAFHAAVQSDAERGLKELDDAERENKDAVRDAGEKEAWFREFDEFVENVAAFLDDKYPRLERIENDFISLLAERTRIISRQRAKDDEDDLSLFFGVPSVSVLPPLTPPPRTQDDEEAPAAAQEEPAPKEDGDPQSSIREARRAARMAKRAALSSPDAEDIYTLSPTDAGAFTSARSDTSSRLGALFADVNAPEFQDPRALTPSGSPHPGSIVERFDAWRRRYPDEYSGAWGGLALAGVWEFWARKEMGAWDVLRAAAPLGKAAAGTDENEKDLGPAGLDEFAWHAGLTHYAEAHVDLGPVGGDDETIGTIVSNVVVPRLISFVERGAYDPFSSRETRAAVEMVEQVGYVLERHGWRFQSLITAYLTPFRHTIQHLCALFSRPPSLPAPAFHPSCPRSLLAYLHRLLTLLRNLLAWNGYVSQNQNRVEQDAYALLVDKFVGEVLWRFVREARDVGGREVARTVSKVTPQRLLAPDVRSRFEALAA